MKRMATYEIGTEGKRFRPAYSLHDPMTHFGPHRENTWDSDDWGYLLWLRRKELRKVWRAKLKQLRKTLGVDIDQETDPAF